MSRVAVNKNDKKQIFSLLGGGGDVVADDKLPRAVIKKRVKRRFVKVSEENDSENDENEVEENTSLRFMDDVSEKPPARAKEFIYKEEEKLVDAPDLGFLSVPGGRVLEVNPKFKKSFNGYLPSLATEKLQKFLEYTLGAVLYERDKLLNIIDCLPPIFAAFLRFNNCEPTQIRVHKVCENLVEPILFQLNIEKSALDLFVDEHQFTKLVANSEYPKFTMLTGVIDLMKLNPIEDPMCPITRVGDQDINVFNIVDHTVAHILTAMHRPREMLPNQDYHYKWNECGVTLSSMFAFEAFEYVDKTTANLEEVLGFNNAYMNLNLDWLK